jgi:hypothetical protein
MSPVTHIRTSTSLVAALAMLLAALIPATAAAATRPITFDAAIDGSCLSGRASDNSSLTLTWRDANGALKEKAIVPTSALGYWSHCVVGRTPPVVLKIGDRLKAVVGATTRLFVIPRLSLNVDRVNDVFRGKAPAGTTLRLFYPSGIYADYNEQVKITAGSDGRWSHAPGRNIIGGIMADMRWRSPGNDFVWLSGRAPVLRVTLGKARFSGETKPNVGVKVFLENATTGARKAAGSDVSNKYGVFAGRLRNAQGALVPVAAGDRLRAPSLAADANWIVPRIQATANAATDVVAGRCFDAGSSAQSVKIAIIRAGATYSLRGYFIGSTGSDGSFAIDFTDGQPSPFFEPADIKAGDRIEVNCLQDTGDWVGMTFRAP